MNRNKKANRRRVLKIIGAGVVGGIAISGTAAARGGGLKRELAEVRAATAKYNNPQNAVADGYVPEEHPVCGMGYHYPHQDFVAAMQAFAGGEPKPLAEYLGSLDRTDPPVLVYGETEGGLVLGAAEYLTLYTSTDLFPATEEDHWHPFVGPTYALHAWVHQPNPKGVFHPTNPRHQFTKPEWCEEEGDHH